MNNKPLLDDLQLFCTVVRKSSFAASARELGVSNAYVSKRIALLEETLQVRLLHRTTRRISLTESGDIVHQWAQRILDDVVQMGEAVSSARAEPSGLLRLCTSSGFGRNRVGPALSALALRYPALEIELELLDRPVDLIGEGFHLDIRIGAVTEPNLISRRIGRNRRVLCAAPPTSPATAARTAWPTSPATAASSSANATSSSANGPCKARKARKSPESAAHSRPTMAK